MSTPDIPTTTLTTILGTFHERWRRSVLSARPDPVTIPPTSGLDEVCPVWRMGRADPSNLERVQAARPRPVESDPISAFLPAMIKGGPGVVGTGHIEVLIPQSFPTDFSAISRLKEQFVDMQFFLYTPPGVHDLLIGPYCAGIASALRNERYTEEVFHPDPWPDSNTGIHYLGQTDQISADPSPVGVVGESFLDVFTVRFRRRHFGA